MKSATSGPIVLVRGKNQQNRKVGFPDQFAASLREFLDQEQSGEHSTPIVEHQSLVTGGSSGGEKPR